MVVLGEVVPKNLGIKKSERYAVMVAPLLLMFYPCSRPFIYVLERGSTTRFAAARLGPGGAPAAAIRWKNSS